MNVAIKFGRRRAFATPIACEEFGVSIGPSAPSPRFFEGDGHPRGAKFFAPLRAEAFGQGWSPPASGGITARSFETV